MNHASDYCIIASRTILELHGYAAGMMLSIYVGTTPAGHFRMRASTNVKQEAKPSVDVKQGSETTWLFFFIMLVHI